MGEILPFKRPKDKRKSQGDTLCRSGHHKWVADKGTRFDVKTGRLVTLYRCARCGKTKVKAE